ncbi:enoyl-CoA hydratase/isomerase family protein [Rhizobium sp. DKSPLA3]|uniref:Enoyl-CoA hydratase/isomerase family protein n=1 Tax=Rhizobium quercicola TaxID=2901226 RepID=A0A9X1SZM3_9HYPH|nr:enoyl-CoA hydratase/isomerase family protein [Rhizobium quercicola]MCD7107785.1 enoyl-CoA hydratase/isomerase family protein [Rhizobium quercicola]
MTAENETVIYAEFAHVALISFNRPDVMNASSYALRASLSEAMDKAEANREIRVVVLTGEGRSFGAGADLTEGFTERRGTINEHILKDHARLIDNIAQSDKTYIAALPGATAGVSLAYALSCDMIIMAENAFLYSPFAGIGLVPDGGTSWMLLRAFGYHKAFEIIADQRRVTAAECLEAGLANQVVPADTLRQTALARAEKLATQGAPLSLKYTKKILRHAMDAGREATTRLEADFQFICNASKDKAEGIEAFLQKRKPNFSGS